MVLVSRVYMGYLFTEQLDYCGVMFFDLQGKWKDRVWMKFDCVI